MSGDLQTIFVGNLSDDIDNPMIRELFESRGAKISSIDIKKNYAFVYYDMESNSHDMIDNLITELHLMPFGKLQRSITVQRSKSGNAHKLKQQERKEIAEPTNLLFVVGFDTLRVMQQDIKTVFGKHGKVTFIDIKKSYCFVEFEKVSDATTVLKTYNGQEVFGRTLSIQYSLQKGANRTGRDKPHNDDRHPDERDSQISHHDREGRHITPSENRSGFSRDSGEPLRRLPDRRDDSRNRDTYFNVSDGRRALDVDSRRVRDDSRSRDYDGGKSMHRDSYHNDPGKYDARSARPGARSPPYDDYNSQSSGFKSGGGHWEGDRTGSGHRYSGGGGVGDESDRYSRGGGILDQRERRGDSGGGGVLPPRQNHINASGDGGGPYDKDWGGRSNGGTQGRRDGGVRRDDRDQWKNVESRSGPGGDCSRPAATKRDDSRERLRQPLSSHRDAPRSGSGGARDDRYGRDKFNYPISDGRSSAVPTRTAAFNSRSGRSRSRSRSRDRLRRSTPPRMDRDKGRDSTRQETTASYRRENDPEDIDGNGSGNGSGGRYSRGRRRADSAGSASSPVPLISKSSSKKYSGGEDSTDGKNGQHDVTMVVSGSGKDENEGDDDDRAAHHSDAADGLDLVDYEP